jgi:hypothetical protein
MNAAQYKFLAKLAEMVEEAQYNAGNPGIPVDPPAWWEYAARHLSASLQTLDGLAEPKYLVQLERQRRS